VLFAVNRPWLLVAIGLATASLQPARGQIQAPVDPKYVVPPTEIPKTPGAILEMLRREELEVQALLEGTSAEGIYPRFTRVRDLSVAMEDYVRTLPEAKRARASLAVRETVRLAWLLHEAADFGQASHPRAALQLLRPAIAELVASFRE